jgi:two-component system, OmpR family, alkaline phosphatase synthesis response regulator PhoP
MTSMPTLRRGGPVSGESPARVLITEDNPQGAELLEAFLAETAHETRVAGNGEEALKLIAEWKPDVVLLDVMMPRLSGFEVCRAIRANPATRGIGVLMVTALDQHADIDRAVDVGTDDFLTKPINKAELLLRVRALLRARKQPGDMARTLEYIRSVEENLA